MVGEKYSITTLQKGQWNPILVSITCSIQDSASLVAHCKSLTLEWDSLSLPQWGDRFYSSLLRRCRRRIFCANGTFPIYYIYSIKRVKTHIVSTKPHRFPERLPKIFVLDINGACPYSVMFRWRSLITKFGFYDVTKSLPYTSILFVHIIHMFKRYCYCWVRF